MFITVISLVLIILFLGQTKAFAKNDNLEIIKSDEQYIIYVKDLLNKDFKYAVSNDEKALDPNDINLNYINAVKDDDEDGGNSVALLTEPATFIYTKKIYLLFNLTYQIHLIKLIWKKQKKQVKE